MNKLGNLGFCQKTEGQLAVEGIGANGGARQLSSVSAKIYVLCGVKERFADLLIIRQLGGPGSNKEVRKSTPVQWDRQQSSVSGVDPELFCDMAP